MEEIKHFWSFLTDIIIGGVTIGTLFLSIARLFGKNLIDLWFKKRYKTFQTEIDRKNQEIQSNLDRQLEQLKIQMSVLHTERLNVVKEACKRFVAISNQISAISSYDNYDCKHNVDFSKDCALSKELSCDENCIVNYWTKTTKLDKYIRETFDFLQENQMFFSIDIVFSHMKFLADSRKLTTKAIEIGTDVKKTENERALECIKLFKNFNNKTLEECQFELISHYRELIGVSELSSKRINEILSK